MIDNNLKLEIFIPIEIKPREFVSQLLLSGELAKNNIRVYLGSKKAIDKLVENKKNNSGIYLYKGGGSTVDKFKKLSKKVSSIAVLDQEISPAFRDYKQIKNRFVKGSLKFVSRLYYVGPEAKKSAIEVLNEIEPRNIKAFGWPRVDIWEPSLHHIWEEEINKIKSRFPKPYLFFCSDFGCNTETLLKEKLLWIKNKGAKKSLEDIEFWSEFSKKNYERFNEFIEFLKEINSDPDIPRIIIRPHPTEDHFAWKEKIRNLKNINVIYEGDVSPWLLASEGLLHRGCTTAIEAAISRKKIAFFPNFSSDHETLPSLISSKIENLQSLKYWIKRKSKLPIENPTYLNLLKKHTTLNSERAVTRIAEDISTLSADKVTPSHIYEIKTESINISKIRNSILKKLINLFKKKNSTSQSQKKNKMQDGIKLSDCKSYLSLMYPKEKFNLDSPSSDLIKIEILN